ncbi:MAG: hypothetical protein D6698_13780 [Gammaproteobacteria bacterium]|nr:MAG: hypothetical protein D6698_13780 [Gammaproteobacteria bacterium]
MRGYGFMATKPRKVRQKWYQPEAGSIKIDKPIRPKKPAPVEQKKVTTPKAKGGAKVTPKRIRKDSTVEFTDQTTPVTKKAPRKKANPRNAMYKELLKTSRKRGIHTKAGKPKQPDIKKPKKVKIEEALYGVIVDIPGGASVTINAVGADTLQSIMESYHTFGVAPKMKIAGAPFLVDDQMRKYMRNIIESELLGLEGYLEEYRERARKALSRAIMEDRKWYLPKSEKAVSEALSVLEGAAKEAYQKVLRPFDVSVKTNKGLYEATVHATGPKIAAMIAEIEAKNEYGPDTKVGAIKVGSTKFDEPPVWEPAE